MPALRARRIVVSLMLIVAAASAATDTDPNQWGITWTLDHAYTVGQFANGDFYVVADTVIGPDPNVVVTDIDPGFSEISQDGETFKVNGNMVNPDPEAIGGGHQAYDERTGTGTYNVALLRDTPITLTAGDSLISTISWIIGEDGCPARYSSDPGSPLYHMPRPPLRVAAVLTVLSEAPPAGSFRPPYAGTTKTLYNVSSLNLAVLPDLTPAAGMADFNDYAALVDHAWLDHVTSEQGEWHNPTENMAFYGRNQMSDLNVVGLALMTDLTEQQKTTLATGFCQIGIDLYGIVKAGGGWGKGAGAMRIGRKWPIILTGKLLGDADMLAVGTDYPPNAYRFQEDAQAFYITQNEVDLYPPTTRTNCAITHEDYLGNTVAIVTDSNGGSWWNDDDGGTQPIQSNRGFPGYFWLRVHRGGEVYDVVRASNIHEADNAKIRVNETALAYYGLLDTGSGLTVEIQLFPAYRIGYSTWVENYYWRYNQMFYSLGYQISSTKAWSGAALGALILNLTTEWNCPAFFDWTDFYMAEQDAGSAQRSQDVWTEDMWDLYRDSYGSPPEPNEPPPAVTKYLLARRVS